MNITKNIFKLTLFSLIFLETLSFIGFKFATINLMGFIVLSLLVLVLSMKSIEYGLYFIVAELIIGSKGYLFSLDLDGVSVSIRIAFWLIVMSVWGFKIGTKLIKCNPKPLTSIFKTKSFKYLVPLLVFSLWGLASGFLQHNSFNNIFDDFNAWLFFLLVLPITSVFIYHNKTHSMDQFLANIKDVVIASLLWMCTKTLLLLYVFSHNIYNITPSIYKWVRDTGIGEITQMEGGFYRIFFQSHIFALLAFIFIAVLISKTLSQKKLGLNSFKKDRSFTLLYLFMSLLLSVTIISFSRSNWVGLITGLFILEVLVFIKFNFKKIALINIHLIVILVLSIAIIAGIVKFPYPNPIGGFSTTELLAERASQVKGEAGVSSRFALLPELFSEIKESPVYGKGFGATVTYKTSDPRVLKSSATGDYTTYAFEWGWLDIWLKIGIFGVISYIYYLYGIIFKTSKNDFLTFNTKTALAISLVTLVAVSFFSPYFNHPLGIGFLLFSALTMEFWRNGQGELQKNK